MVLSATKRATQVPPIGVPGMSQKANPTVNAGYRAATQGRMRLQHRVQHGLILPDKRVGAIVLVPIRPKREKFLDGDCKKARLSVKIWIRFSTPSSYLVDAKASRGRPRIFVAPSPKIRNRDPHKRSTTAPLPRRQRQPIPLPLTTPHTLKSLPERSKTTPSSFQRVGQFS